MQVKRSVLARCLNTRITEEYSFEWQEDIFSVLHKINFVVQEKKKMLLTFNLGLLKICTKARLYCHCA